MRVVILEIMPWIRKTVSHKVKIVTKFVKFQPQKEWITKIAWLTFKKRLIIPVIYYGIKQNTSSDYSYHVR